MSILISLIVVVAVLAVWIWIVNQIPAPFPGILRTLLIVIGVVLALIKIWPMLG